MTKTFFLDIMIEFTSTIIIEIITKFGYLAIISMMFLESALIPIPSEVVMPFSGFVTISGGLSFWGIVFFGVLGQMLGSIFIYFIGKWEGRHLLEKYGKYVLIRAKDIYHADKMFERHGDAIVFFGRVLPVMRTFISLPAGVSKMKFSKFALYSFLGIVPWTLGLAWLGVKMGENWEDIKKFFHIADIATVVVILFLLYKYISAHLKNAAAKNDNVNNF